MEDEKATVVDNPGDDLFEMEEQKRGEKFRKYLEPLTKEAIIEEYIITVNHLLREAPFHYWREKMNKKRWMIEDQKRWKEERDRERKIES